MRKRILSVVFIINLALISIMGGSGFAASTEETSKVSEEVLAQMESMSDSEKITIYVFLEDIDCERVMNKFNETYPEEYSVYVDEKSNKNARGTGRDIETIQASIQAKREIYSKSYLENNQDIIDKHLNKESQIFMSKYSSLCILNVTKPEIEKLVQDERVASIQLFKLFETKDELATANQVTRANYNRDMYGLTGEGVRIGQIEGYVPYVDWNNDLNSDNVTINPDTFEESYHASQVASIMVGQTNGLVPDALLFSTGCPTNSYVLSGIEWLLDQGVNVINMSCSFPELTGAYDILSMQIDFYILNYEVHFVKSAGNDAGYISSPGMTYNAITVGGFDDMNTLDHSDDTMYTDSSFDEAGTVGRPEKPNLIAPACNIENLPGWMYDDANEKGTSFAAPQVTGTIAQLIDYVPSLAMKQTAVGAILMASTFNKVSMENYGSIELGPQISDIEGTGKLDARAARSIPYYGNYWSQTIYTVNFPYTMTDYISASSTKIRIAIFWLKRATPFGNLDLRVYNPNGNLIASSTTVSSNYEVVEFDPVVSGMYIIKIFKSGSNNSTKEHVGVAIW